MRNGIPALVSLTMEGVLCQPFPATSSTVIGVARTTITFFR